MEEIYLSETLKAEYLLDFESVLSETHESWKIHPKIKDHLIKLNQCSNFQTLYSAYPEKPQTNSDLSYLKIAYSKIVELELLRSTIPYLLIVHNSDRNSKFNYRFYQNKDNAIYREGPRNFKMGCLTNPEYFRVNHLHIKFNNYDPSAHDKFWASLTNALIELDEKYCS